MINNFVSLCVISLRGLTLTWKILRIKMSGFTLTPSKHEHTAANLAAVRLCDGYWAITGFNPMNISEQDPMKMASFYKESRIT